MNHRGHGVHKEDNGIERRGAGGRTVALDELNKISKAIIGAAIEVHKALEPGLLESTYEACLAHELADCGRRVERKKGLPVSCRGLKIDCGYRVDLLVEDVVIVELKSVQQVTDVHRAQLLTYLKLAGLRLGLLINFNVPRLVSGVQRVMNGYDE
ncbi:MAG: GxxExxY protein [Phycisphaerae bacterium]|nr:GxxExxY protein [Phycisphaerae bacterium]